MKFEFWKKKLKKVKMQLANLIKNVLLKILSKIVVKIVSLNFLKNLTKKQRVLNF